MTEKIRKVFQATVKGVNEQSKRITVLVTSENEDRQGDVVVKDAIFKRIDQYMKHPVLLASHDYYSLQNNIGKAIGLKASPDGVEAEFEYFAGKGNDEADWAWELAKLGIAAYSIGFMAYGWDPITKVDPASSQTFTTGRKYTDIELLEISQVTIPANRDAVQNMISIGQLAVKSFEEGKLQEHDAKDKEHYSEEILSSGVGKTEPITEGVKDDEGNAIIDGVESALKEVNTNGN